MNIFAHMHWNGAMFTNSTIMTA